jgi:hypothetical protein
MTCTKAFTRRQVGIGTWALLGLPATNAKGTSMQQSTASKGFGALAEFDEP